MDWGRGFRWLFDSEQGDADHLLPRWLFLRALGLIYFSAFYSLVFQIRGLIGPEGILPAGEYLAAVSQSFPHLLGLWFAPTLLWISSGPHMLLALCWAGMAASLAVAVNFWPRAGLAVCFVCLLSFVGAAQVFSGYQSDGMLLEAGFLSLFFAPGGLRPGLGTAQPPSRASLFLLRWEWFRIYFESGMVKLLSGDPEWRHLTAMDEYYQNGPLPTWIGWYMQHLPHWFQEGTAFATLAMELGIVWMLFLPRRWRFVCFLIVTPWEAVVILTANYTFLNYLVLSLGFLLLDDRLLEGWRRRLRLPGPAAMPAVASPAAQDGGHFRRALRAAGLCTSAVALIWIAYATTFAMARMVLPDLPLPSGPVTALEPMRIANQYGLFAVMTRGRYEIEFQGSSDGKTWVAYPFRYKPQDVMKAPGVYAPYQPRFEWNLWFASLGSWQQNPIVGRAELRLLQEDPAVLALFAGNPFAADPPRQVRAVLWQYWFTTLDEKRRTGAWWRRRFLGVYAPVLGWMPDGQIGVTADADPLPDHE